MMTIRDRLWHNTISFVLSCRLHATLAKSCLIASGAIPSRVQAFRISLDLERSSTITVAC